MNQLKRFGVIGQNAQTNLSNDNKISQFQRKPKLGDDQYKATIQTKIDDEIEQIFISVNHTNEEKRKYADVRNIYLANFFN